MLEPSKPSPPVFEFRQKIAARRPGEVGLALLLTDLALDVQHQRVEPLQRREQDDVPGPALGVVPDDVRAADRHEDDGVAEALGIMAADIG